MQVHVEFRPRRQPDRAVELSQGAKVKDLLAATGQGVDSTLVIRGNDPIPEDEELRDGESILLLSAFSGG